jgi:hypothetical protein
LQVIEGPPRTPDRKRTIAIGVAAAVVVAVVLWSRLGPEPSPPYERPGDLANAIGCAQRQNRTDDVQRRNGVESETCYIKDNRLVISVFERSGTQDGTIESLQRRVDADPDVLVIGDRFLVVTQSRSLAEQIADAVGGRIDTT